MKLPGNGLQLTMTRQDTGGSTIQYSSIRKATAIRGTKSLTRLTSASINRTTLRKTRTVDFIESVILLLRGMGTHRASTNGRASFLRKEECGAIHSRTWLSWKRKGVSFIQKPGCRV